MTHTLKDAVYGQAVADALGVPYEFQPRGTFHATTMTGHGTHNQPAGTWSDDTSMALAICDSIRSNKGRIDPDDMRERFNDWYQHGDYTIDGLFDIGNTTIKALRAGHGMTGEYDNGNGSLMRTIPLAFTDASETQVEQVSAITHANPTSTRACVKLIHYARQLAAGHTPLDAIETAGYTRALADEPEGMIRSGGYVLDTLKAAVWCLVTTDDYAGCALKAVNLGDDTDTTAAVAGGLAGIVYGTEGIPAEWIAKLRGKDVIDACLFA
ncbi:ADP-ribosylglycohydrolase family protein [Bifidobacterium imperatoris]|uniref:ADP-ribosylglycohydrolase n=1 Tax=Bifidobacterium imperatoris TaxID=2020965 RepID=A0A2N5ISM9_9BIFI|nr:ADP-ribosylglycohydrolase family protein [Bifidobacterium imperatoris]PLS24978.1 ADP-ribosylglycohydrolase [Bifidobacterium imperatoris]QSY58617.1 ADP-ribosylglycohydrolase family protein [Bifidobacterium imperatoris]